jgi:rubrerythrin
MSRLIDGDALYEQLKQDEEMARNRVLDTESTLPYPNNLNPSYTRYVAQMNERTRLKHMIADAPTIEERKKGKWTHDGSKWVNRFICSECGYKLFNEPTNFCPNCGVDMRGEEHDRQM